MVKEYKNGKIIEKWSQFDNDLLKKADELELKPHTRKTLGEILRRTAGFCDKDGKQLTGYWCSPRRVSATIGVPYSTVKDDFKELIKRKMINTSLKLWVDSPSPNKTCTWVEINLNLNEWVVKLYE